MASDAQVVNGSREEILDLAHSAAYRESGAEVPNKYQGKLTDIAGDKMYRLEIQGHGEMLEEVNFTITENDGKKLAEVKVKHVARDQLQKMIDGAFRLYSFRQ